MTTLDAYDVRARLVPGVLALLPPLALALALGLAVPKVGLLVGAVALACAVPLMGLVRDRGRKIEAALWASWGGPPSTRRLRWTEAHNLAEHRRLHADMATVAGAPLPTRDEETADPSEADDRYWAACARLRARTQRADEFPLVKLELMAYGFRRNALGLKPVALAISALTAGVAIALATRADATEHVGVLVFAVLSAGAWLAVRPNWVRAAAELYADRLFETLAVLTSDPAPRT